MAFFLTEFGSLLLSLVLSTANSHLPWPDKNGPSFNGHAAAAHARGLPVEWDAATGKNVAWHLPLEHKGHSTPVIAGGRIWLTAATADGTRQYVYCIDEKSGEVLHHELLFENPQPEPLGNELNTYASPSCVAEDDAVYVHFGSYGTARLDPDTAEVIWERRDIKARHFRGPGSSPVLFENLVILTFDGIDKQFLIALHKETGTTVWRTDRSTDYGDLGPDGKPHADGDYRKAYSTPALAEVDGQWQVISVGSRAAFGYDARSGEEIWTVRHDGYNAAIRPLFFNNTVILNTGANSARLMAVRLDNTTRGDVTESHVVWDRTRQNSRLPTPVIVGQQIYMITDNGVLYCLSAVTGDEIWSQRIGGTFVASPVVAGEHIYLCDEDGKTTVIKAAGSYQQVAENELPSGMRASPAIASGALYLRTFEQLYKIAAP